MKFCCIHCHEPKEQEHYYVRERKGKLYRDTRCNKCRKLTFICRNFAITRDEYMALMENNDGRCDACRGRFTTAINGRMTIDHDHDTGQIRGVLCHSCNCAIHRFTTPAQLLSAAEYLRLANERNALLPIVESDLKRLDNFAALRQARKEHYARRCTRT